MESGGPVLYRRNVGITVLRAGDRAPEFEGTSSSGEPISLERFRGRPVVVYFFPKAGSYGCTRESMEFRDAYPTFVQNGIQVIGVSVNSVDEQRTFATDCSLPFPLVADSDREIARRFGVLGAFGFARRVTFLLDAEGRVQQVVESALPWTHVRAALRGFGLGRNGPSPDRSRS